MIIYTDYVRCLKENDRIGSFDSWTILDKNTSIKKCDKSFFDYKGSGVFKEIYWFFVELCGETRDGETFRCIRMEKEL